MFNFIYMFHEAMAANMWSYQQQAKLVVVVVLEGVGSFFDGSLFVSIPQLKP